MDCGSFFKTQRRGAGHKIQAKVQPRARPRASQGQAKGQPGPGQWPARGQAKEHPCIMDLVQPRMSILEEIRT